MHIKGRKVRYAVSAVAVAGIAALALSACTTSGSTGTSSAAKGGTVTVAVVNDFTSFNSQTPQGNLDTNGQVGYLDGSYGTGFQYIDNNYKIVHDDKFGKFEKISDSPLTVKYTLNKNDKWSDGQPVTADDMILGWAIASGYYDSAKFDDQGNVTSGTQYFSIAGSTAGIDSTAFPTVGDNNTSITLKYATPYVDWELVNPIAQPAHIVAKKAGLSSAADLTKLLKTLPKGVFSFTEEQDDGAIHKVTIEITDDEFIIDLRDNPKQSGSKNSSREGVEISSQLAFKAVTDTAAPGNGGFFRPLRVITQPGTIFHVEEPGALGYYSEVEIRLFDLLLRCLAPHLPGLVPAGNFSSICGTVVGGPHPDHGRHYTIVEPQLGGWGAWKGRDGNSAIFSGFHGDTFNCPAEVAEARYGLAVDQMALNPEPGGEGEWRGGKGINTHYRVRADNNFLSIGYTRSRIPPWGVDGGLDGTPNYVEVLRPGRAPERYAFGTDIPLNTDDVVRVVTGNGGGFGDPKKRSAAAIADDIKNGYLTPERAAEIYGYHAEAAE